MDPEPAERRRPFPPSTYGDSFADVYDEWYGDVSDVPATVAAVSELAGDGRIVELGVGTGRLAVPLAAAGHQVVGLDASPAMLARLAARAGAGVHPVLADMAAPPVRAGSATVVLVACNTLFNVAEPAGQRDTVHAAAAVLAPGGRLVVEAFVPAAGDDADPWGVSVRGADRDHMVLIVTHEDPTGQVVTGQHIELTAAGAVRLRPWRIRYLSPGQLDELAAAAGLTLEARWSGWERAPFRPGDPEHVSVYRSGAALSGTGAGRARPAGSA